MSLLEELLKKQPNIVRLRAKLWALRVLGPLTRGYKRSRAAFMLEYLMMTNRYPTYGRLAKPRIKCSKHMRK